MIHNKQIIKQKDYCIMSLQLARILMDKGYELHNIAPNKKFPNLNVYYFIYTESIEKEVREYEQNNNKNQLRKLMLNRD
jgi:hypothetical protein